MTIFEVSGTRSWFLKTNTDIENYVQEIYEATLLGATVMKE